jgi:hypothetical protein
MIDTCHGPVGPAVSSCTAEMEISAGRLRWARLSLLLIMLQTTYVGFWAAAAPNSFAPDFPGFGLHWTVWSGSVDEHFVRDVGLQHLALLVAAVQTFRWPRFGRVMGMACTVLAVPHLLYHSCHGTGLTGWAIATSLAGLTVSAVAGVVLILISPPGAGGDD